MTFGNVYSSCDCGEITTETKPDIAPPCRRREGQIETPEKEQFEG